MLSVQQLVDRLGDPVELRAGNDGLRRVITWAHAVDTTQPWLWVEPGDLVMTTGTNLPSDAAGQVQWIQHFDAARVSGILLEIPTEGLDLTAELLTAAEQLDLPLLTAQRPILFNHVAHLVVESALQSRWERTEMIQRLFSSYTSHLRRGIPQQERLQELCRMLDAEVCITHGPTDAVIFEHTLESSEFADKHWTRLELPGRGREVAYLKRGSSGIVADEEFMWHWSTLVSMELGFEKVQLDHARAQGEPMLFNLIEGRLDTTTLQPMLEQRGMIDDVQLLALGVATPNTNRAEYLSRVHLIPGLRNAPHVMATVHDVLYIALPYPAPEHLLDRLTRTSGVTVGLSRRISAANPYPQAANQAHNAMQFARNEQLAAAHFDDFVDRRIGVFDDATAQQRIDAALGPLMEHDTTNNTELLHTLRTYLAADGVGTQTAQLLVIHRQTLIYRLKMIQRLTGIDPNATEGIVEFYNALRALDHLQPRNSHNA